MTTTTDEMMSALSAKADEVTAAATTALDEYANLRIKVQESAWALGWQNSIGPVMENMLSELGLAGRPHRAPAYIKIRLDVTLPGGVNFLPAGAADRLMTSAPMRVAQERTVRVTPIYLPRGTELGACYCAAIDEHADPEQVRKAVKDYHGWTDDVENFDFEVLAIGCCGDACRNADRTA